MSATAEQLPAKDEGPPIGIFSGISNEDYHRGPGISKSGLDLINMSPAHYMVMKQHPKPPTEALIVGTAFHTIVLEPDVFEKTYVKDPYPGSTAKAAKEAREALEAEGKIVLHTAKPSASGFWDKNVWRMLHNMRDAVMAHPTAGILLDPTQGKAEQSVYWMDGEVNRLCKCRPDFINDTHNVVIDLKSTDDASYTGFAKSCAKFRYLVQDPFYRDGLRAAGRPVNAFIFIAVEKQPPYGVAIYTLGPEEVEIGRAMYRKDLDRFHTCKKEDEWPVYPSEVRDLEIPQWGLRGNIT